jgi:hypothetical protein
VFYAPELAQGFGLSGTLGLGGFSNGEAQKAGFAFPHYNTSRLFIRQTFGFGGEQETIEEDQTHFGGKVDATTAAEAAPAHLPTALPPTAHTIAAESGTLQVEVSRIGGIEPAIKEAVAVVKSGQPALVNVWTQPR